MQFVTLACVIIMKGSVMFKLKSNSMMSFKHLKIKTHRMCRL